MPNVIRLLPVAVSLAMALALPSCGRPSAPSVPETFSSQDMQAARKAITANEISLMLRSGYSQSEVIHQIKSRHLAVKLDARAEESVRHLKATPALIQALKDDANVLTAKQQRAYQKLIAEKQEQVEAARYAEEVRVASDAAAQDADRERRQKLSEQTLKAAQSMQDRVTLYDKALRDYASKKSQLEYQIKAEQNYIDKAKGRGASDESLAGRYEALEGYKKQLNELEEPAR